MLGFSKRATVDENDVARRRIWTSECGNYRVVESKSKLAWREHNIEGRCQVCGRPMKLTGSMHVTRHLVQGGRKPCEGSGQCPTPGTQKESCGRRATLPLIYYVQEKVGLAACDWSVVSKHQGKKAREAAFRKAKQLMVKAIAKC